MAKAKPAGKSAAKKSKSKKTKRKSKGEVIESRPIIIKGGALPPKGEDDPLYSVVVEATAFGNLSFDMGAEYPWVTSYPEAEVPTITSLQIVVQSDPIELIDVKVDGFEWSITLVH